MKKFASGKPALRLVCQQEFCKFYPDILRIPHLILKLRNDTEQTFKCKWPYGTSRYFLCIELAYLYYMTLLTNVINCCF